MVHSYAVIDFDGSDEDCSTPKFSLTGGKNYIEPSIFLKVSPASSIGVSDKEFDISESTEDSGTYLVSKQQLGYTDTEEQRVTVSKAAYSISNLLKSAVHNSELTVLCENIGIKPEDCLNIIIANSHCSVEFDVEGDLLRFGSSDDSGISISAVNSLDGNRVELDAMHISQTLSNTSPDKVLEDIGAFFSTLFSKKSVFA